MYNNILNTISDIDIPNGSTKRMNCPNCNGYKTFTVTNNMGSLVWNCYGVSSQWHPSQRIAPRPHRGQGRTGNLLHHSMRKASPWQTAEIFGHISGAPLPPCACPCPASSWHLASSGKHLM